MRTATTPKPARSPWLTFLPAWVLANVIGWGLMSLQFLLPFRWLLLGGLLSIACGISLLQWLCLQSFLDADLTWLLVSTMTYGGYLWIITLLNQSATMAGLLAGGLVGLFALSWLQRWTLNSFVDYATSWVIVSPVAATFAFMMMLALMTAQGLESAALAWVIFGAIYGGLTGAHLIWLKTTTKPTSSTDDLTPPWKRKET